MFVDQSLHSSEHRIGYSDLAFGPKKANIQFQAPKKHPEVLKIWSPDMNPKLFLIKDLSKLGYLVLAFMADKGQKGQHLDLKPQKHLEEVWGQCTTTRVFLKKSNWEGYKQKADFQNVNKKLVYKM